MRDNFQTLKRYITKTKKIVEQMKKEPSKIKILTNELKKANNNIPRILDEIHIKQFLVSQKVAEEKKPPQPIKQKKKIHPTSFEFERESLERLKKKEEKEIEKKLKKPSAYVKTANRFFSELSFSVLNKGMFKNLKRNLIKANISFLPTSYISVIFFTTLLSGILSILIALFFLFFNVSFTLPIITPATGDVFLRFLKVFWIIFVAPLITFLFMYIYPSLEKKSIENKINQELPFVTIHMSAVSGSMVEPSKIFSIILSTKEYPYIEKEFIKLLNKINIYGYDLVTALRDCSTNNASKKLAELFNGLATTITSGGDLPEFFDKRSQTLLFEYRLDREKYTRTAETFMDIYISVVIAAPMILMLLLMMIKISGLGISFSASMITLIMVLGVGLINIVFLTFLHLKQPSG